MDEILRQPRRPHSGAAEDVAQAKPPLAERVLQWRAAAETGTADLLEKAELLWEKTERLYRRAEAAVAGKRIVSPLNFLAAAAVIGLVSVVTTVYTPSYVVAVDGVPLGTVTSPQVFEQVVERVETRATKILGYDYSIGSAVSYQFALSERDNIAPVTQFETYLFDQIGEVMKSYVLKVDGQFIGAVSDRAAVDTLLSSLKAPYQTENTVSAEFTSAVTISHEYTAADVQQDVVAMRAALTQNTNGQTTYEVVGGDTFMAIAMDNGMTMKELEALNPSTDINKLYIGQVLIVKETIPFLSVKTVDAVTYTEAVACPVEEVPDETMYQGDSKILVEGVPGQALITAEVTRLNGKEQGRTISSTQVVSAATTRRVAVGTKERPKTMPKGYFIWPVYGRITSYYGYRSIFGSYSYHSGLDIATSYGTAIGAADGGTVVFAGTASGSNWSYGKLVIIDHGNGKQTYYGHCSSVLVSKGDKVYQGQTIARVGSTGRSTGNHCHFEVQIGGTAVNPLTYLD